MIGRPHLSSRTVSPQKVMESEGGRQRHLVDAGWVDAGWVDAIRAREPLQRG